jgi:MFS family permease
VVDEQLRRAVRATYTVFAGSGFAFANWASRIPQVRQNFHLRPASLGLVLFAIAAGSVVSMPMAGPVIARIGPRLTVAGTSALLAAGLAAVAGGYLVGLPMLVVGLFVFGFANGSWDVAMNVHGAAVERRVGRSIMPRFHAGWSMGTVAGALVGVIAVAVHLPVTAHLGVVAVLVVIVVPRATKHFLAEAPTEASGAPAGAPGAAGDRRPALAAWLEPRTLAVGAFVLAFAFAEGTANDWTSLAAIDGYHVPAPVGTLVFATFLAAMTTGRWFCPALLDRYGRVPVARCLAMTAIVGVLLFVFGPGVPFAFVGVLLWGAGTSVGFPMGMSAGADQSELAAGRVSVIATIGYCSFLGGPPLVGFLGDQFTVLRALTVVAVLLGVAIALAPATRPPGASPREVLT